MISHTPRMRESQSDQKGKIIKVIRRGKKIPPMIDKRTYLAGKWSFSCTPTSPFIPLPHTTQVRWVRKKHLTIHCPSVLHFLLQMGGHIYYFVKTVEKAQGVWVSLVDQNMLVFFIPGIECDSFFVSLSPMLTRIPPWTMINLMLANEIQICKDTKLSAKQQASNDTLLNPIKNLHFSCDLFI